MIESQALEQGGGERAAYGEALIERLSADLSARFGRGFSKQNLWQMRAFHLAWPVGRGRRILQTPSGESDGSRMLQTTSGQFPDLSMLVQAFPLPWSAYVRLLSVRSPQARTFYEAEALRCGWSVAQLNRQISSQFYERTALSGNKAAMLEKGEQPETAGFASICCSSIGASGACSSSTSRSASSAMPTQARCICI